jgi:hypothetical protein
LHEVTIAEADYSTASTALVLAVLVSQAAREVISVIYQATFPLRETIAVAKIVITQ